MTKICSVPPIRVDMKAIFLPSDDQAGPASEAGLFVRFTGLVPSGFITYTSSFTSRFVANAILVPSGDQAGRASVWHPVAKRVTPLPSPAFIVKMWGLPSRFVAK